MKNVDPMAVYFFGLFLFCSVSAMSTAAVKIYAPGPCTLEHVATETSDE